MIHRSSRKPAMEPITMPAICPPDSVVWLLPLSISLTTVVVAACRGWSTFEATSDSVLVGLMCAADAAALSARRLRTSRGETDSGASGAIVTFDDYLPR